ncbi:MAG: putative ClC chloride channel [Phycisphaerales bacterium]|jgi:CIC family chloride channel protein|nr:putative ClC chloride channel [Phycisphaerales bacterium]
MASPILSIGLQSRLVMTRLMSRLGLREHYILLPMAVIVGCVTAGAGVAFHMLINYIRDLLYRWHDEHFLYGHGVWLLILLPALGGLAVGLISTYLIRAREGHGVVDVMESVIRNRGFTRPLSAIEKILTSAITIGSGGSAGAEGPIVQIGAGIASGVGTVFQVARAHMPVLIACGSAAGISAIFNSPIGGVLFTLEVILLDFSIRAFAPVVLASVIANVSTRGILRVIDPRTKHQAIFVLPESAMRSVTEVTWGGVLPLLLLGVICGATGVALTRLMYMTDERFHALRLPRAVRPAVGGALLGVLGVIYVVVFGWLMLHQPKPIGFRDYPMPAFFGDGYGAVQRLFADDFYSTFHTFPLLALLAFLCLAKIVGTCLTLGSGGSGGIIAPSLFLGATTGALLGVVLGKLHAAGGMPPGFFAIIGMGAVLAAVVHGPLSSILILFEVTDQRNIILPAMLACVAATGTARLMFPDSIYTLTLRRRGVRLGTGADLTILRRIILEQVRLEPAAALPATAPAEKLLQLTTDSGVTDFVITDEDGVYCGMVVAADLHSAVLDREAIPLLLVGDLMRTGLPCVKSTDDLASVLETFSKFEVAKLPVCLSQTPGHVIGLVSRRALMDQYHRALQS